MAVVVVVKGVRVDDEHIERSGAGNNFQYRGENFCYTNTRSNLLDTSDAAFARQQQSCTITTSGIARPFCILEPAIKRV